MPASPVTRQVNRLASWMSLAGNIFHGRSIARPNPFGAVATPPAGKTTMVMPSFKSRTASWRTAKLFFSASLVSEKSIGSE